MILLISRSIAVLECASAIHDELHDAVVIARSQKEACELMKCNRYSAVVFDEWELEHKPAEVDDILRHLTGAVPVIVNFATTSGDRLRRVVRAALERWNMELGLANENASAKLAEDLKDELTALLLSCDVLTAQNALTPAATEKLKDIDGIAKRIAKRLETGAKHQAARAARV